MKQNMFQLRLNNEHVKEDRRKPNLTLVQQNLMYIKKVNHARCALAYIAFCASMPLGCLLVYNYGADLIGFLSHATKWLY